jgi:fatty-acyl-CoA synthase
VETVILDDADNPVAAGTVGEIAHRSAHLMLGYLDDEDKTAQAFAGGWFHSGDLGYYDEHGLLHVVDRKKDMIKTGGENVASREVEEVLYRHDGIEEAAVFGVSDPVWVEAVVAAVVIREGADVTEDEVLRHCRDHLAGFKTPKRIFFVDALPKNPSGKLLKRDLRERFSLEVTRN